MSTNVISDRNIGRDIAKRKRLFRSNLRYLALH